MGLKWGPNRIFDAEALRKPLKAFMERSCRPPSPPKSNLGRLLADPHCRCAPYPAAERAVQGGGHLMGPRENLYFCKWGPAHTVNYSTDGLEAAS